MNGLSHVWAPPPLLFFNQGFHITCYLLLTRFDQSILQKTVKEIKKIADLGQGGKVVLLSGPDVSKVPFISFSN